ncbi:MAG TPA: glycosyltransferase [Terriglobales bacterium]|nr:glycosyltransferase [Terriglobales bacterium]
MKRRLVVVTELIAPYRIPVFNELAKHECIDLSVIFLSATDPTTRQWRIYSDEIRFSYQVLPSWRNRVGKYNLLLNQNVAEVLQLLGPDAILCGGYNYLASWQALRWSRRNDVRFLLWSESTTKDARSGNILLESLKQSFFSRCDGFVVPGISAREYAQQMGALPDVTFVAPNAVDSTLFARRAESARADAVRISGRLGLPARYFLFVGRLVKEKGVQELLNAYATLPESVRLEVGLVLAGDGPLRAELESQARTIFPGCIDFAGFVHREELASYYALAECLVFPTHSDTWGMVVNEAMACGLPVICTWVAGCAADLVSSNGILVKPQDSFELSCAMQEIACNSALRERMSNKSREIIRRYAPECCARGIAEATLAVTERADATPFFNSAGLISETTSSESKRL